MTNWRENAKCVGLNPRWWDYDHPHEWVNGARICATCPVRVDCFTTSRDDDTAIGLYAGIVLNCGKPLNISTHADRFTHQ